MSAVWSVRGVSSELRRSVVRQAGDAGLSVGEWLEQALAPVVEGGGRLSDGAAHAVPPADEVLLAIDRSLQALDEIAR
jgi:hypothetical protein